MSRFSNRLADHHQDLPTVRSEVKGELSIDPPRGSRFTDRRCRSLTLHARIYSG